MASRFEKFSERARRVLTLAQEEAQRLDHSYIGTEHILLGLVREDEGMAAKVLVSLGVGLSKVRSAVEFVMGHGEKVGIWEFIFLGVSCIIPVAKGGKWIYTLFARHVTALDSGTKVLYHYTTLKKGVTLNPSARDH